MSRRQLAWAAILIMLALIVGTRGQLAVSPRSAPIALSPAPEASPQDRPTAAHHRQVAVSQQQSSQKRHVVARPSHVGPSAAPAEVMSISGPPSVSPAFVDATLRRVRSPLAGLGAFIYRDGERWDIDPVYLLAFATYFDRRDALPEMAHNVGHVHATPGEPTVQGFRVFPTWQAGIEAWYRLINRLYVRRWHLRTVDAILPVYAPSTGAGVENELNDLRAMITAWRHMAR